MPLQLIAPAGLLALLALPAILLLYILKVKRPEVRVSTIMFWRRHLADRQANAPWQRLRRSLLLIVQLAAALAIALALIRPGVIGAAGVGTTTVILLDASPSMRTTDVDPNRFAAAQAQAKQRADQLSPGQEMAVVLVGEHPQLLAPPTSDTAVLNSAIDRARPSGAAGDLGEAISLANALLAGRAGGSMVLLGDGHSKQPATPPALAAPLTYIPIGTSGENMAIEAISRQNGVVFLRLANYGRTGRDLKVEMYSDGRLVDALPARVDGNNTTDLVWNNLPSGTRVLEARLSPHDVFALDDSAWLVTAAPPPHKALLVTVDPTQNGFLQKALGLRPGLELTVQKPEEYKAGGLYDLFVFDGWLPPGATLPQPALIIDPPQGRGPVPAGQQVDPGGVLPANPREPLLGHVNLKDVHVQSASRVTVPSGWRTVIGATENALVMVHEGEPRVVEFTFDIHHSDLPLRAAFPILVQNLVSYLLPGGFENQAYPLGAAVTLAPEPDAKALTVNTPAGRVINLSKPFAPFVDTAIPGVYTVTQQLPEGTRVSRFVVQLQDPTASRISPGAAPVTQEAAKPSGPLPRGTLEIWPWLAAAALVLAGAEWLIYLRGR
jgi:hypothetical protein